MSGKTTAAAILFKVFLPCVLWAAAIVRYNGLSGVYLLCLMALPLMPNPTRISLAGRTGNYMKILIVLACLACTSQLLFQVVLLSEGLYLYGSQLQPCNGTESILRQIGFQRLDDLPISTLCRLIVPDVMVCLTAVCVYIVCRILILRQIDVTTERSNSRTPRRKHSHQTTLIINGVQNALTICLCAVAGVVLPSAISAVYFLSFLIIVTWWSLYKSWGSKFNFWMLGWLIYSGAHVILLYLYQFQFFQEILPPEADIADSNQDFLTRLLGLTAIVTTDCTEPRSINVIKDQHWPVYVNPLVLLIFYLYTAWQVRIWMDGDRNEPTTKRRRRHSTDNRENGNQATSYEALPSVQVEGASGHSQLRQRRVKKQPSTNTATDEKPSGSKTSKFGTIMAYVTKQCFIGALVVMMAWSITYHSWLTFVLLLWACAIWIIPVGTTRKRALYTSPILVFYAECLLSLQFIYGLNLTMEELPTQKGNVNLKEIGLVKYTYPCIPLGVQLLFTGMFWLTLRQFWREQCLAQICPKSKGIILQPVEMIFSGPNEEIPALKAKMKQRGDNLIDRAHSQAMSALGNMIWGLFSKYWILLCGAMLLIVSLESNVDIFKIIYMGLFLLIINIFLLNFTVFRFISKPFAWVVVLYSVCTLVLIYTYQFENFPDMWTNGTGISLETLEDLGLQRYGTQDLFINLLIPTAFIIIFMVQLHYFHDKFLKMSEIRKPGYSSCKGDEEDGAGRSRLVTRQSSACPSSNGAERKRWTKARLKEGTKDLMVSVGQQGMNGTRVVWRLLEIHMVKLVMGTIVVVVVHEVTAINYVFVLLIFLAVPFPRMYRIVSMLTMMWLSVVFLVKMICQLELLTADDWITGCNFTEMKDEHQFSVSQNFSALEWWGIKQVSTFHNYVIGYVAIIIMLILESIVRLHQKQFRGKSGQEKPKNNIIFPKVTREKADGGLKPALKYLANYCFYKFGLEICFVTTAIVAAIRLDAFGAVYLFIMICMVFSKRKIVRIVWPVYTIVLVILFPITYAGALGIPPALCLNYPWTHMWPHEIITWLYFPDFLVPPNPIFILADFFQLLFVCLQWNVFYVESDSHPAGNNYEAIVDVENIAENPVPNFTFNRSYLDLMKNVIFNYNYWVTLAVIFLAGTSRVSIFGLIYIVFSFFFMRVGTNILILPTNNVMRRWNLLLLYNLFVIFLKIFLQIMTCAYVGSLLNRDMCWLIQLLGVVCLQDNYTAYDISDNGDDICELPTGEASLIWDNVVFVCLLIQRRIFTSNYFQYVVLDLQEEKKLASRGAELINELLAARVHNNHKKEETIMKKIKEKMARIRERRPKGRKEPGDHYEAVRGSGGYYMFQKEGETEVDGIGALHALSGELVDEESDLESDGLEEEHIEEKGPLAIKHMKEKEKQKLEAKRNPWELLFTAAMTSTKDALRKDDEMKALAILRKLQPRKSRAIDLSAPVTREWKSERAGELWMLVRKLIATGAFKQSIPGTEITDAPALHAPAPALDVPDVITQDPEEIEGVRIEKTDETEEEDVVEKTVEYLDLFWRVLTATMTEVTRKLNKISEEYRFVGSELRKMTSEGKKRRFDKKKLKRSTSGFEHRSESLTLKEDVITEEGIELQQFSPSSDSEASDTEAETETASSEEFEEGMPRPIRLIYALLYAVISQSQIFCYFLIILNQLLSASILSLPLPILVFLWAMLSKPRPTKSFWLSIITYTEIVVILKYLFQFTFYPWNSEVEQSTHDNDPLWWPRLLGIDQRDNYAVLDLCILLAVFFHRSVLKRHGLWTRQNILPELDKIIDGKPEPVIVTSSDRSVDDTDAKPRKVSHVLSIVTIKQSFRRSFRGSKRKKKEEEVTDAAPETTDDEGGTISQNEDTDHTIINLAPSEEPTLAISGFEPETDDELSSSDDDDHDERKEKRKRCPGARKFYAHMMDPTYSAVADVYVPMFLCDVATFIIGITSSWAFGEDSAETTVTDLIISNNIPATFLILLLVQFFLIIIDRGIYLRKSLNAKFIFLILMVILVHAWMFFLLPKINNRKFVDNTPAQLWYFFKCIYFGLSAFQVRSGYPTRILGNCICKSYSIVNLGMFYVWKLCPFVLELRILMDWIWTKTTLTLAHWVIVEDIFNSTYIIKCWRDFENEYPHLRGQEKEKIVKYLQGGGMLLGIIFIIWFPLILISLSNTATIKNPPSEAHFTLQLGRYEPLFTMSTQEEDLEPISNADWQKLNRKFEEDLEARTFISSFRREDVVVITIPGNSSSTWDISPPTRASLYNDLISPTSKVVLKAKYSFGRDLDDESVATWEVSNEHYVHLDPEEPTDRRTRDSIAKQIDNSSYLGTVDLLNVFPPYILVPAIGVAEPVKSLLPRNNYGCYGNISLGLERAGDTEWWTASEIEYHGEDEENLQPFLTIYTFNERVDSKLFAPFSSYGIIGLYISFVLVVGRLVRLIFSGTTYTVMFDEFPNVDYILKLCQDMYTVREGGEMELEEDLMAKLLFLYRSPETLIQFTKYKTRLKKE